MKNCNFNLSFLIFNSQELSRLKLMNNSFHKRALIIKRFIEVSLDLNRLKILFFNKNMTLF